MRVNLLALALDRLLDDKYFPIASEVVGSRCVIYATKNLCISAYRKIWSGRNAMNAYYDEEDVLPPIHESIETLKRGVTHLLPLYVALSAVVVSSLWLLSRGEEAS